MLIRGKFLRRYGEHAKPVSVTLRPRYLLAFRCRVMFVSIDKFDSTYAGWNMTALRILFCIPLTRLPICKPPNSFLEDSETVWGSLVMCWSRLHVGDPERIPTDSGSCFTSTYFENACKSHSITLSHTNVQSHHSFSEGETYHYGLF